MSLITGRDALPQRLACFSGKYECHITVDINRSQFDSFSQQCVELDAKALIIELGDGITPIQPMLCKRLEHGEQQALQWIKGAERSLSKDFTIVRIKIEASIHNAGIPVEDSEAKNLPADCYFEHHVKIALAINYDIKTLRGLVGSHDGHLSRNPLSNIDDIQYRFVTQRFYGRGEKYAYNKLQTLEEFLKNQNIPIVNTIREFNIYDSNTGLDAGWIVNNE